MNEGEFLVVLAMLLGVAVLVIESLLQIRVKPVFAWFDLWVGVFVDLKNQRVFVLPFPCIGVVITKSVSDSVAAGEFIDWSVTRRTADVWVDDQKVRATSCFTGPDGWVETIEIVDGLPKRELVNGNVVVKFREKNEHE